MTTVTRFKIVSAIWLFWLVPGTALADDDFDEVWGHEHQERPSRLSAPPPGIAGAAAEAAVLSIDNLSVVGHFGPMQDPIMSFSNADVWAVGDTAFVSSWVATLDSNDEVVFDACPATGVKLIDISDPTSPTLASVVPGHPGNFSNDVKAIEMDNDAFEGTLMVVGNEGPCGPGFALGLELWDVTDPYDPVHLSSYREAGPIHNLFLFERKKKTYAMLASSLAEVLVPAFGSGIEPAADFVIVDVTDPRNPALVSDWTIGRDAGLAFGSPLFAGIPIFPPGSDCTPPAGTPELCRGDDVAAVFGHDVWANSKGTVAYLSYWDAGLVLLDISDPASPSLLGRGAAMPSFGSDEGNLHGAASARKGKLVLAADEDLTAGPWGFMRIFDTSDPTDPVEVGAFATANALNRYPADPGNPTFDETWSIHNVVVDKKDRAYLSWYADGIRVVDFSTPTKPVEIASFVLEAPTMMWGVYLHGDLILASDMFSGLWILELAEDDDEGDDESNDEDEDFDH